MVKNRLILTVQLLATLAIIAWFPTNAGKALALLTVWAFTFGRLKPVEIVLYVAAAIFFTVMDVLTVSQGQFIFDHPDFLGLPVFEPLMWGFYLLHTSRIIGGPLAEKPSAKLWVLALLFAAPFMLITNPVLLCCATSLVLMIALAFFHQRHDLAFVAYMILLGAAIEFTGVHSGQWHYPAPPALGVPLWFAPMWGGIGLFVRRLVLPELSRLFHSASSEASYLNNDAFDAFRQH